MRLIRADGPIADAIRRYDPRLDIRYSWEAKQWAVVFKPSQRWWGMIPKPVAAVQTPSGVVEKLLPEKSDNNISYRTRTQVVGYFKKPSWRAMETLVQSDTWAGKRISQRLKDMKEVTAKEQRRISRDRWFEARKFINWHANNNVMAEC